MQFKEEVEAILKEWGDSNRDGEITTLEMLTLVNRLTYFLTLSIKDLGTLDGLNDIVIDVEELYDLHFAPINLEGVNDWLEPAVDKVIRRQIRPFIERLAEEIHGFS